MDCDPIAPLPRPTQSLPGTASKLDEMRRRFEQGLEIHSPDDNVNYETAENVKPNGAHNRTFAKRLIQVAARDPGSYKSTRDLESY